MNSVKSSELESRMPLKVPILITGPPHSGKSLLARFLGEDSEFYCFGEPLSLWNYGMGSSGDDTRKADDATPEVVSKIRETIDEILATEKKTRYIDEFSYHSLRLPFTQAVVPEAKVLMVVRDPADVIPEMMFFWQYRDTIFQAWKRHRNTLSLSTLPGLFKKFFANYVAVRLRGSRKTWGPTTPDSVNAPPMGLAEKVARQWESLVRIGIDDLESCFVGRSMLVRFEDIVNMPETTMPKIAEFCEIEGNKPIVQLAEGLLDPTYRFEKRDKVDRSTSASIDQLIKVTRERLGYKYRENWE